MRLHAGLSILGGLGVVFDISVQRGRYNAEDIEGSNQGEITVRKMTREEIRKYGGLAKKANRKRIMSGSKEHAARDKATREKNKAKKAKK